MPEMSLAAGTANLDTTHAMAGIDKLLHGLAIDRRGEARPAGAAVIFVCTVEQRQAAAGAMIEPGILGGVVATGKGSLGAMLAQHMILLRSQALTPLRLAEIEFFHEGDIGASQVLVNGPGSRIIPKKGRNFARECA